MSGTPRLRSSYPSTPGSGQRSSEPQRSPQDPPRVRSPLPNLPETSTPLAVSNSPLIPVDLIDAPSQRAYTALVYSLLWVWCLYDWSKLLEEDTRSIGLFIKWICIYAGFLYGVPQLRVPWLEWSATTTNLAFGLHAALIGMLMFRVPVSWPFISPTGWSC